MKSSGIHVLDWRKPIIRKTAAKKGFTLLEIIIAVTLMTFLLASASNIYSGYIERSYARSIAGNMQLIPLTISDHIVAKKPISQFCVGQSSSFNPIKMSFPSPSFITNCHFIASNNTLEINVRVAQGDLSDALIGLEYQYKQSTDSFYTKGIPNDWPNNNFIGYSCLIIDRRGTCA